MRSLAVTSFLFLLVITVMPVKAAGTDPAGLYEPSVFQLPALRLEEQRVTALLLAGQTDRALEALSSLINRFPKLAELYFVRAVVYARTGRQDQALVELQEAVNAGFNNGGRLAAEPSFQAFRQSEAFSKLLKQANSNPPSRQTGEALEATLVRDGVALVSESNTSLEPLTNTLQSAFEFRSRLFSDPKVMTGKSPLADRLNDLYRQGKAAGNLGDLYDNRDRKHSKVSASKFPQLAFIEYAAEAKAFDVDFSFNDRIFFNAPTVGNASLGINGMWSVPRTTLTNPRMSAIAYLQYRSDHLYIYPSVRDYAWPEYGTDNFAVNTPYLIVSKGKSGSDRPFLEAAFIALAALPPDVKKFARENGLISPTVQMLLRRGQTGIDSKDDYLSPKAHPVVFDGEKLDFGKIVDVAQSLTVENLPPRVEFSVLRESAPQLAEGQGPTDTIFTTPAAAARVVTKVGGSKSITVSMAATEVRDGISPAYHWRILEGDPSLISIEKKNKTGSVAELTFKWHATHASLANPEVQTDRADIGLFVEVDGMISSPAIVSVYFKKN